MRYFPATYCLINSHQVLCSAAQHWALVTNWSHSGCLAAENLSRANVFDLEFAFLNKWLNQVTHNCCWGERPLFPSKTTRWGKTPIFHWSAPKHEPSASQSWGHFSDSCCHCPKDAIVASKVCDWKLWKLSEIYMHLCVQVSWCLTAWHGQSVHLHICVSHFFLTLTQYTVTVR